AGIRSDLVTGVQTCALPISLPITLTLKSGTLEANYPTQLTDQYGFFTITLGTLPTGTYTWRADDSTSVQHPPNYLANSGVVNIKIGRASCRERVNIS